MPVASFDLTPAVEVRVDHLRYVVDLEEGGCPPERKRQPAIHDHPVFAVQMGVADAADSAAQDQNGRGDAADLAHPPEGDPDYNADPLGVCVVGDAAELTTWGAGVPMVQPCPGHSPLYYEVGILFAAGGNPAIQWKYKWNDCVDWEPGGNRMITIDDSGPTFIIPWVDHWNNYVGDDCPLCGIGTEESTWGAIKKIHN